MLRFTFVASRFMIFLSMCSHCGECFCFGVAKLARVLFVVFLFWLVCSLVLGLILFVFVSIVVVFSVIGGGLCLGV